MSGPGAACGGDAPGHAARSPSMAMLQTGTVPGAALQRFLANRCLGVRRVADPGIGTVRGRRVGAGQIGQQELGVAGCGLGRKTKDARGVEHRGVGGKRRLSDGQQEAQGGAADRALRHLGSRS